MSSIPGWLTKDLDKWGNYHQKMIFHEGGWSHENILSSPEGGRGRPGHRILAGDMPKEIARIDLVISQLPDPLPNVAKAKYWFHRWPEWHYRAGMEIFDSDRAVWFGYKAGWFKNKVRLMKRLALQGLTA